MKLRIAMLQLLPGSTLEEQYDKGFAACREAKSLGADMALFPEMWSTGYRIPQDSKALQAAAISADSDFICGFGKLAAALDMSIGITFLETFEPSPRNSLALFDRHGNRRLVYAKIHTCDFGDEAVLTPGNDFFVTDLDTAAGKIHFGAMICYDREFPESARILMLQNAEIILVPNACPMEINRISQLRARAFENMTGIVTVNYPAGMPDCNGHSTAFDGIVYPLGSTRSRDTLLLETDETEGVFIAEFDIEAIRAYRAHEVHGNCYRHTECYDKLLDPTVRPPFIRPDKRDPSFRQR